MNPSPTTTYPPVAACGSGFSFLLLSNGQVMSCGLNGNGALGNNATISRKIWLGDALGVTHIKAISANEGSSYLLSSSGELFGSGEMLKDALE
jgi:alpha-tubulin suppressor-like RCC1 family protein